jgi:putative cardiolipin synthase
MIEYYPDKNAEDLRQLASAPWLALMLVLMLWLVSGCAKRPPGFEREVSYSFVQPELTSLGQGLMPLIDAHPEQSGFLLLSHGVEALEKRLALVDAAERALDIQYYIWNSDRSGRLMAAHVLAAAERGVKVRLLLDDINVGDRDQVLAILDSHPRIQVRVYNPFRHRSGLAKWVGALAELGRINRRMHNKVLLVDASAAIVGGRNIGDEYFDLHPQLNFLDRDLLAVGSVVDDIAASFDLFWNSDTAYPITVIAADKPSYREVEAGFEQLNKEAALLWQAGGPYAAKGPPSLDLDELTQELSWANAELVYDDPLTNDTINDPTNEPKRVAKTLRELAQQVKTELLVESAYLIPTEFSLDLLGRAHEQNIRVWGLTNSLASNDLVTNHSGYARHRRAMLEAGAELYELRPDAAVCANTRPQQAVCREQQGVGLHSKSVVFDRKLVYVGSFNVNQRSTYLNTETALIIHSPMLAEAVAAEIQALMRPENSWQVKLNSQGQMQWTGPEGTFRHEPATSWWRRLMSGFLSRLPLEKYL